MDRQQLLTRLEKAWTLFKESYAGLTETQLMESGVVDGWSVKDMLAHVSTWEEEALKYLPLIVQGGKPPRYSRYGGLDAFNAQMIEQKRNLALFEVIKALDETHGQLVTFLQSVPEEQFLGETPFRHRLRLDTYSHYLLHDRMIREWRERLAK